MTQNWIRIGRYVVRQPFYLKAKRRWRVKVRDSVTGKVRALNVTPSGIADHALGRARKAAFNQAVRLVQERVAAETAGAPLSFEQAVEQFLIWKEPMVSPEYFEDLRLGLRNIYAPTFGNKLLSDITVENIERVLQTRKWRGRPLSERRKGGLRNHLGGLFTWAVKRRYVQYNPCRQIDIGCQAPTTPKVAFQVSEVTAVLRYALARAPQNIPHKGVKTTRRSSEDLGVFLVLGLYLGARPMEILRLRRRDIDFHMQTVSIIPKAKGTLDQRGRRVVPLHEDLNGFLRALFKQRGFEPADTLLIETGRRCLGNLLKRVVSLVAADLEESANEEQDTLVAGEARERASLLRAGCVLRVTRRTIVTWLETVAPAGHLKALVGHSYGGDITLSYTHPGMAKLRESVALLPKFLSAGASRQFFQRSS